MDCSPRSRKFGKFGCFTDDFAKLTRVDFQGATDTRNVIWRRQHSASFDFGDLWLAKSGARRELLACDVGGLSEHPQALP
jgi:hypothetical protein